LRHPSPCSPRRQGLEVRQQNANALDQIVMLTDALQSQLLLDGPPGTRQRSNVIRHEFFGGINDVLVHGNQHGRIVMASHRIGAVDQGSVFHKNAPVCDVPPRMSRDIDTRKRPPLKTFEAAVFGEKLAAFSKKTAASQQVIGHSNLALHLTPPTRAGALVYYSCFCPLRTTMIGFRRLK
jgi:hypothetical protein